MAEEEKIPLFQIESNTNPFEGRDPSLYGTAAFPFANFITKIQTGEIVYDPEDTMHREALANYKEVYEAATTADQESMISPEQIAGFGGALGGAVVGGLADRFLFPETTINPTASVLKRNEIALKEQTEAFDKMLEKLNTQITQAKTLKLLGLTQNMLLIILVFQIRFLAKRGLGKA